MIKVNDEVMVAATCWQLATLLAAGTVFMAKVRAVAGDEVLVVTLGGQYPPRWVPLTAVQAAHPVYDRMDVRAQMLPRRRDR